MKYWSYTMQNMVNWLYKYFLYSQPDPILEHWILIRSKGTPKAVKIFNISITVLSTPWHFISTILRLLDANGCSGNLSLPSVPLLILCTCRKNILNRSTKVVGLTKQSYTSTRTDTFDIWSVSFSRTGEWCRNQISALKSEATNQSVSTKVFNFLNAWAFFKSLMKTIWAKCKGSRSEVECVALLYKMW